MRQCAKATSLCSLCLRQSAATCRMCCMQLLLCGFNDSIVSVFLHPTHRGAAGPNRPFFSCSHRNTHPCSSSSFQGILVMSFSSSDRQHRVTLSFWDRPFGSLTRDLRCCRCRKWVHVQSAYMRHATMQRKDTKVRC